MEWYELGPYVGGLNVLIAVCDAIHDNPAYLQDRGREEGGTTAALPTHCNQ